ncbi:MAG: hypothetical protein IJQ78_09105 [Selenomonadaceae bacterium]|nr:hypothetical protein [Selenomonadaceae bacterium]
MKAKEKLLQLMIEHPDFPVVPVVNNDIWDGSEYGYWLGRIGSVCIKEYTRLEQLADLESDDQAEERNATKKKAIVVYIEPSEE